MEKKIIVPNCAYHVPSFLGDFSKVDEMLAEIPAKAFKKQMTYAHGWPARPEPNHTMARFAAPGVSYSYKGKAKPIDRFTSILSSLVETVGLFVGVDFNCVVVNTYEAGVGLYPHTDSKYIPELGTNPTIAALSFGQARTFSLHTLNAKGKRVDTINTVLNHGDLFVMHGECDQIMQHSIPSEPELSGKRISLTFRKHNTV